MCPAFTSEAPRGISSTRALDDLYWPARGNHRIVQGAECRCFDMLQAALADLAGRRRARSTPGALARTALPLGARPAAQAVLSGTGAANEASLGGAASDAGMASAEGALGTAAREGGGRATPPPDCPGQPAGALPPAPSARAAGPGLAMAPSSRADAAGDRGTRPAPVMLPVPIARFSEITREPIPEHPGKEADNGEEATRTPGSLSGDEEHSHELGADEAKLCVSAATGPAPEHGRPRPVAKDIGYYREEDTEVKPFGGLFSCTGCVCKRA